MLTPHKIHAILRKAGFERSTYEARVIRDASQSPLGLSVLAGSRKKDFVDALEAAGVKVSPCWGYVNFIVYFDNAPQ